jgi:ABC-2 type transport system permease protein
MSHSLRLYFRLLSIQLRSQMTFRFSFWLDLVSTGILNGAYFASTYLVLQRFGTISGWTVAEVAFLYGMAEVSFGLMDMLFSGFDPDYFSLFIRQGALDQVLLRPVNVVAQIFGSRFLLRRFGRIFQGAFVLGYAFLHLNTVWTTAKLVYLPVVIISQITAMGALFMMGATLVIWTVQPIEALNIVTYGGVEMMSYPASIFNTWLRGLFTYLVPLIFMNYYPALFFLDRPDPLGFPVFAPFLAPLVGGLMLWLALRFWCFGLKHYQGAGT